MTALPKTERITQRGRRGQYQNWQLLSHICCNPFATELMDIGSLLKLKERRRLIYPSSWKDSDTWITSFLRRLPG